MSKLETIEKSVTELNDEEFRSFAAWFNIMQAERWDAEFEADATDGRLDGPADEALAEFRAGRTRAL